MSTGAESCIDHFAVSKSSASNVIETDIVDSANNFSDHCPIICKIAFNISVTSNMSNNPMSVQHERVFDGIRWDKSNLNEK